MRTAEFIKRVDGNGDGRVYKLDPPITYTRSRIEEAEFTARYVWVSAAIPYSGPETYIFPCDEDGEVRDWGELPGSVRGSLDHAEALRNAGYSIVDTHDTRTEHS